MISDNHEQERSKIISTEAELHQTPAHGPTDRPKSELPRRLWFTFGGLLIAWILFIPVSFAATLLTLAYGPEDGDSRKTLLDVLFFAWVGMGGWVGYILGKRSGGGPTRRTAVPSAAAQRTAGELNDPSRPHEG